MNRPIAGAALAVALFFSAAACGSGDSDYLDQGGPGELDQSEGQRATGRTRADAREGQRATSRTRADAGPIVAPLVTIFGTRTCSKPHSATTDCAGDVESAVDASIAATSTACEVVPYHGTPVKEMGCSVPSGTWLVADYTS